MLHVAFPYCSGYHIRLIRVRSSVRYRAETQLFFSSKIFVSYKTYLLHHILGCYGTFSIFNDEKSFKENLNILQSWKYFIKSYLMSRQYCNYSKQLLDSVYAWYQQLSRPRSSLSASAIYNIFKMVIQRCKQNVTVRLMRLILQDIVIFARFEVVTWTWSASKKKKPPTNYSLFSTEMTP